jgi:hypothetical protein
MWAPAIGVIGGGVLRTPTTHDTRRRGVNSEQRGLSNTEDWLTPLPTPKAGDGERGRDKARARPDRKGRELATVVRDQMLPIPCTCSAMASRLDTAGNLEGERFPNLETVVAQQLLTPTATDWKGRTNWQAAGRNGPQRLPDLIPTGAATYLNPSFVEEMMGFPVGWTA